MKIHPAQQGSLEWMIARSGIPTASEFDQILTPAFKMREGQMVLSYLAKKLAEAWTGGPLAQLNTFSMDQGQILEEEAVPFAALQYGWEMQRVGLCTTDDGRVGASPDALIGDDSGAEIKCPELHTHVKWLLDGELPKDHAAQVHGCMFVTGRSDWHFLSYRRRMPPLHIRVERDEAIQEKIREAVTAFLKSFDDGWARLCEINEGPPKRPAFTPTPGPVRFSWETADDITP